MNKDDDREVEEDLIIKTDGIKIPLQDFIQRQIATARKQVAKEILDEIEKVNEETENSKREMDIQRVINKFAYEILGEVSSTMFQRRQRKAMGLEPNTEELRKKYEVEG